MMSPEIKLPTQVECINEVRPNNLETDSQLDQEFMWNLVKQVTEQALKTEGRQENFANFSLKFFVKKNTTSIEGNDFLDSLTSILNYIYTHTHTI